MAEDQRRRVARAVDAEASDIIGRIEELGARCDALEASNSYLAAQLTEVNKAWRDAIAAIAAPDPQRAAACMAIFRDIAAQCSGRRQRLFSEMADIMEKAADRD